MKKGFRFWRYLGDEREQSGGAGLPILMMLVTLIFFSWWILTDFAANQEERIFINADLTRSEQNRVASSLTNKKNTARIRAELTALTWVESVRVRKNMGGDILIRVVTEKVVAYLPEVGYYLANGQFLTKVSDEKNLQKRHVPLVKMHTDEKKSPTLDPKKFEIILPQLARVFDEYKIVPTEYRIGRSGDLRVSLRNGPELVFGTRSHRERLRVLHRFLAEYRRDIRNIRHIDLRYENALAVNWKGQVARQHKASAQH